MTISVAVARTAAFAGLYTLATFLGRLTVMDGTSLSLVWPAAGVAAVWFCAQRRSPVRWADAVALSLVTIVVNTVTGAPAVMAAGFVAANLVQVMVFVHLLTNWRPQVWGGGGSAQLSRVQDLWALLGAAFIATFCGALIGPTTVWLVTGTYSWPAAAWLARNTASMLLIGAVGLRVGYAVTSFRARHGSLFGPVGRWPRRTWEAFVRTPRWRSVEYVAVAVCSTAAYLVAFKYSNGLPLAFPLLLVTVWAAVRLSTTFVVWHDMAVGVVAILFTLSGDGPFATIASYPARALVSQLFVGMVAVVGLALALSRDERESVIHQLDVEKAEASRQAALMSAIIESMSDGLSVVDAEGRVLLRNPAAIHLLGRRTSPNDQVAAAGQYGLSHLDGRPICKEDLPYHRVMSGETHTEMNVLVRNPGAPDGRIVHVDATALTDTDGSCRAVMLFRDVSAEHRQRDALTSFAGVVAHDLLNPLATVDGWTDAAVDELVEAPTSSQVTSAVACLARVQRAAGRMRVLINDLLAYTTARDAAVDPAPVDLNAVVTDITAARTDAAIATDAPVPVFWFDRLPTAYADPALVRQLLDNLIANAVKYTAPGVTPDIRIVGESEGEDIRITIIDNGIGIPAGQHTAIFDDFHRAHRAANYAGTGLGLGICRRIVERHGGTISASDNPGSGSRFSFTLPAAATVAAPASSSAASA